jgi:23S rRNA (uracil1939-C5)-methyltransferase
LLRSGPGTRRRADFSLRHTVAGPVVGFARRASHDVVDLRECPILMPALSALIAPLRSAIPELLPRGGAAEAVLNWTDTGVDMLFVPAERTPLDLSRRMALAALAEATDAARISWGGRRSGEPVVTRRQPILRFGRIEVVVPPGAFLQASPESEAAMRAIVHSWLGTAKRIADLFGGVGTLSLGLVPGQHVTVVDGNRPAVAAVAAAVRKAGLDGAADAVVRDLARDPLSTAELDRFDAAIFDPPRNGAAAQAAEMADSRLPVIVAVSCDPQSFAQDARTLVDGGYRLEHLVPVDQFLWSTHVELLALFRR